MFFGQPRVEPLVDGQLRLAVLMVSDSPPARILDLQDFWNGLRTLAHSWSHCVGRPFVQPPPWALQHTCAVGVKTQRRETSFASFTSRPS